MDDTQLRLDGNAAAGLLAQLFAFDATVAEAVCAGCGMTGPIGSLDAYALDMGAILRCPGCDLALVRVSKLDRGYWLDLTGVRVLRVKNGASS